MDLAIVIVSYNVRELTRGCLASLYAALEEEPLAAHVWVVDNASADDSAGMVREAFPQATLLESGGNLGFAGGANLGLRAIGALDEAPRHVLLLNPDTIVAPDALGHLVRFMDEHPRAGLAGARLAYGDGAFQHGAFRFPTLAMLFLDFWPLNHRLTNSFLNGRYPRRLYEADEPFAIDHPLGAAMMARWEAVQEVGPLETDYFMYCEEIDWCLRFQRAGWGIYCVPRARITHLEGQSTRQFRDEMFVALWRSRFMLFERYYSPAYRFLARRIVRAGMHRDAQRVRRRLALGEIGDEEARRRLDAMQRVMEM